MYVDYSFYSLEYGGRVSIENFQPLETKASSILNYYTQDKIKETTTNIKLAVCELIDVLSEEKINSSKKEIQAESVGTYSVTYAKSNKDTNYKKQHKEILFRYLANTDLLYRGGRYVY